MFSHQGRKRKQSTVYPNPSNKMHYALKKPGVIRIKGRNTYLYESLKKKITSTDFSTILFEELRVQNGPAAGGLGFKSEIYLKISYQELLGSGAWNLVCNIA